MTVGTLMTADELLQLPDDGWRYELVNGELQKMSPAGERHGRIAARIIASLASAVGPLIGAVYASETGFKISREPDTVRAPDAAFVSAERLVDTAGFFEGAPDAAIEVVSPNDSYTEVVAKTQQWLRAGTRAVVIVDPQTQTVRIHRAGSTTTPTDAIEIADVIPNWHLPLADLFA